MFYYKNWDRFCHALSESGIKLCTGEESLHATEKFIVLKHDVEGCVPNAHRLASIEHKYGICGSYYVQAFLLKDSNNVAFLQEMQAMGHEISYHYDVLDAHSGNYEAAQKDFQKYLDVFHACGFKFQTICQHGNPVKQRIGYTSNRDFFRNEDIRKRYPGFVDMVVNYSQYVKTPYKYISDAGYRWNVITEPETNDLHPDVKNTQIGDFNKLTQLLFESNCSFVVSTHPHRWRNSAFSIYLKIAFFRCVKSAVLLLKRIPVIEKILSKFYFLAKKI